jgi:ethanolamine ammonia-lyase small subunit
MSLPRLCDFTRARVGLPRAGNSLPTNELLALQLAHARAREAVHSELDSQRLAGELRPLGEEVLLVRSRVPDRATYLRRPDLGRRLSDESRVLLGGNEGKFDVAFVIADGLSATAVQLHAARTIAASLSLLELPEWKLAPFVIVEQGRVAIGDEIGECLGAAMSIVLIGERPGLSSSDSLGIYLSWSPRAGLTDADRNCISNIRAEGLSYAAAGNKLVFLMNESRRRKLSGIQLKEAANLPGLTASFNHPIG